MIQFVVIFLRLTATAFMVWAVFQMFGGEPNYAKGAFLLAFSLWLRSLADQGERLAREARHDLLDRHYFH